jgi:hypothetical protein
MQLSIDQLFADWVEPDISQYFLACLLGLMQYDDDLKEWRRARVVFDVRNDLGTALYRILEELVKAEVLNENELGQYRRNPNFLGCWDGGHHGLADYQPR